MILSAGEALIDMLPRTTTLGETAFSPYAGGAVMNTAIALARLGSASGFLTGLSSDLMGDVLKATLEASQVDLQFCVRSDRPTTLAFVKLVNGPAGSGSRWSPAGLRWRRCCCARPRRGWQ
jgi:fructokinase